MNFYKINDNVLSESEIDPSIDISKLKTVKIHTGDNETEKHVPYVEHLQDSSIKVKIGKNEFHAMTEEHHIKWIKLFINGKLVETINLQLNSCPHAIFMTNYDNLSEKEIDVFAFCNLHGIWKN